MVCNNSFFIGRLTDNPVLRMNETGVSTLRFNLAVQRRTEKDSADFIPCVAFNKTAELIDKFTHKGSLVAIEGHFQSGKYDKNGETKYTLDCIVDSFQLLEPKKEEAY